MKRGLALSIACATSIAVGALVDPTWEAHAQPAATPAAVPLAIESVACSGKTVTLDLVSPEPGAPHELFLSRDLLHWQLAPSVTWEKESLKLRAGLPADGSCRFYRVLCLGTNPAPLHINVQIDAELEDTQGIRNLVAEFQRRGLHSTVYVTAEYANRNAMLIGELFRAGFEIALHGYYTGEQLETMTYAEQKDLLTRAKKAVEGCKPCGTYRPVTGFRPQYFSQNGDTFRVLDELGMTHNSGFKVGQIYLPGHAEDAWPYRAETNLFSIIPITTIPWDGDRVYLCDIACAQSLHWTAAQWEEALLNALTGAVETRRPLVLLLHGWYTGDKVKYAYWQPLMKFLDAAKGRASFIGSAEFVELMKFE